LPNSGSMRNGVLYPRRLWVRHIEGPDCSYWPTPTSQNMAGGVGYQFSRAAGGTTVKAPTLTGAVRMAEGRPMQSPGRLSPTWVEWLMGFPMGWTAIASMLSGMQ
jgi:DNA (cytosine-5)-methyltransferase 1